MQKDESRVEEVLGDIIAHAELMSEQTGVAVRGFLLAAAALAAQELARLENGQGDVVASYFFNRVLLVVPDLGTDLVIRLLSAVVAGDRSVIEMTDRVEEYFALYRNECGDGRGDKVLSLGYLSCGTIAAKKALELKPPDGMVLVHVLKSVPMYPKMAA
ncbi:hypothetical protein HYW53_01040 [Candidatus Giovannonibacteria bacterium]|nr:hypothetical protein [Candidatus Giovannonibacteria bacterium]